MDLPIQKTASEKGSFAYKTVKDRLPVILTRVIDYFCQEKAALTQENQDSSEDLKKIIARWSQLKNEMQTDKTLRVLSKLYDAEENSELDDTAYWNELVGNGKESWFTSSWLLVECYFYRALHQSLEVSKYFQTLDPFEPNKQKSLEQCQDAIDSLCFHTEKLLKTDPSEIGSSDLELFIQLCVWGNQVDLSLSAGTAMTSSHIGVLQHTVAANKINLLVDHTKEVVKLLQDLIQSQKPFLIDVILDNAGYELLTDVCLCLLLLHISAHCSVRLHMKTRPWFVSDTVRKDVQLLKDCVRGKSPGLCQKWEEIQGAGRLKYTTHKFWTYAAPYQELENLAPDLHAQLNKAQLVVFKGDLNYRKLVGDRDWKPTVPFSTALGSVFDRMPPVLALRTIKGGPIVGVEESVVEDVERRLGEVWLTSGECGVVQLHRR